MLWTAGGGLVSFGLVLFALESEQVLVPSAFSAG